MNVFQTILSELKKKIDAKHANTEIVARIISEQIAFPIDSSFIIQKGTHIQVRVSPTIKMQITLKRQAILLALQKQGYSITSIS